MFGWTKQKPVLDHECFLMVATLIDDDFESQIFKVEKINDDEEWYWGITQDDLEYDAYEEITADYYMIINFPDDAEIERKQKMLDNFNASHMHIESGYASESEVRKQMDFDHIIIDVPVIETKIPNS